MESTLGPTEIFCKYLMGDHFNNCNEKERGDFFEFEQNENADGKYCDAENVEIEHLWNSVGVEKNQKANVINQCEEFRKCGYKKAAGIFGKIFSNF